MEQKTNERKERYVFILVNGIVTKVKEEEIVSTHLANLETPSISSEI